MRKVYNFSAGPAMLPEDVLLKAQAELLDWHDCGMSIMELSHRSAEFGEVAEQAETNIRELMGIPDDYDVLFIPGGATAQFAMVPINLLGKKGSADYVDTGIWSKKAIKEAQRYGDVSVVASVADRNQLITIPEQAAWKLNPDAAYLHYTPNETVEGIEFNWVPESTVPLVADMSSMILSRPIDVSKYGIIYAGAQKNLGQAGITMVIIRKDLIQDPPPGMPTLYSYKVHAENKSFYNTPPTFSWYISGLVFEWVKAQGGVAALHELNQRKAKKLYDFIDHDSDFYVNHIHSDCRSIVNVVMHLADESLTPKFVQEATAAGLTNLKGHRLVGGLRASIYNAMPEEGVDKLIEFMADFKQKNQ